MSLLLTQLQDLVARSPIYMRLQEPPRLYDTNQPYNAAIYGVVATPTPRNQTDWRIAYDVGYSVNLRTWTQSPQQTAAQRPVANFDFTLPRSVEYPTLLRTWVRALYTPQPPANYDYRLAYDVPYPVSLRTVVNQAVQFTPQKTVVNVYFPVPQGPEYPISLRTAINQVVQFQTAGVAPPLVADFRVARDVEYPTSLRTWIQTVVQTPVVSVPPFCYDFPVLRGVEYPISLRTWINGTVPIVFQPPFSYDFRLARDIEYPVALRTWTTLFQQSGVIAERPVLVQEWPYAREVIYPIGLRTFVNPTNPAIIPTPVVVPPQDRRNPMFIGNTTGQMGSWS